MLESKKLPMVGHIGYIVNNVENSIPKFKKLYNIENFVVYDFIPERAWVHGKEIFDCKLKIGLGANKDGLKFELIEPISGENLPHASFIEEKGQNIHHIAYYVEGEKEYIYWRNFYISCYNCEIIFEAEIKDEVIGRRSSFYVYNGDIAGVLEISKKPVK